MLHLSLEHLRSARSQRSTIVFIACLSLIMCTTFFAQFEQTQAATVLRGDVECAESGGIVLDANLHTKEPVFDHPIRKERSTEPDTSHIIHTYYYDLSIPDQNGTTLAKTVSARWVDVGFDSNDDRIDLVISWLPDSKWYAKRARSSIPLLFIYTQNPYKTAGICVGADTHVNGILTSCEQHLRINFFKTGTDIPARGSFLTKFTDLDQKGWNGTFNDRWCESIELISGHSQNIFIPDNNILKIGGNRNGEAGTDFRATRAEEGSNLSSGFVVSFNNGAEFWYYSTSGWTDILDQFDVHSIYLSSGSNGNVHCATEQSVVPVGWRGERSIAIDPGLGYKVADVQVDGSSIGATRSYLFDDVIDDHSIQASFEPIDYRISFKGNGGIGVMADIPLKYEQTGTLPLHQFSRCGYLFSSWNTEPDGRGRMFQDVETVSKLTAEDGGLIELFAQWKPITYQVAFDGNEGYGVMEEQDLTYDQSGLLTKNRFKRTGYRWTGWNSEPDGSGKAYSDEQAILNLTNVANDIVTLYAQWEPLESVNSVHPGKGGNEQDNLTGPGDDEGRQSGPASETGDANTSDETPEVPQDALEGPINPSDLPEAPEQDELRPADPADTEQPEAAPVENEAGTDNEPQASDTDSPLDQNPTDSPEDLFLTSEVQDDLSSATAFSEFDAPNKEGARQPNTYSYDKTGSSTAMLSGIASLLALISVMSIVFGIHKRHKSKRDQLRAIHRSRLKP